MNETALLEEHRRLGREVRGHKRSARRHRQLAKAARERQAAIEDRCKALGIAVTIQHETHESGEGDIHGRDEETSPRS